MRYDAVVIGGGAAGLAAAVFLGETCRERGLRARLLLLEKGPRVGKKLLATGNGTCNITNLHAKPSHYHGADPAFVRPALAAFPPTEAMRFFASIGVECAAREDGRVYPLPAQAAAVLDCLRLQAAARGVETRCEAAVRALRPEKGGFVLTLPDGQVQARQVLVCCGGAAAPALGGGTDGYALLTACGHERTPLFPSIVQLKTDTTFLRALKGVRVDGTASLWLDGRALARETDEILFTEYGLSGPAVMQISRHAAAWVQGGRRGRMEAVLDLLPSLGEQETRKRLAARRSLAGRTLEDYFTGLVQKRLGQTLLRAAGFSLSAPAASLTDGDVRRLAGMVKGWRIEVTGTRGFENAQVTAGGVSTAGFDPVTMASRRVKGLYAAGEVLDIDGDCGGFNLQWAWSSAHAAAHAIADRLEGERL